MTARARWAGTLAAIALALVAATSTAATPVAPPPVFEGTWIATAGPARTFHGRWSAQALPGQPDDMQGSWSLVNDAGDTIAQGTWSAHRAKRGFQGSWWARPASGGLYKGTFEAHLPGFKGSLQGMFASTQAKEISGYWRMGSAKGAWYLKGAAPEAR